MQWKLWWLEECLLPQRQRPQHSLLFRNQRLHALAGQANHFPSCSSSKT